MRSERFKVKVSSPIILLNGRHFPHSYVQFVLTEESSNSTNGICCLIPFFFVFVFLLCSRVINGVCVDFDT